MAHEHLEESAAPGKALIEETAERRDRMAVREGETIGLAGLLGSGSDRIVRRLFGSSEEHTQIRLADGRDVRLSQPSDAIAADIGFVPGERALGLVMNLSVRDNILLPSVKRDNAVLDRPRKPATRWCAIDGATRYPPAPARASGRFALGRQPAEGDPREMAGARSVQVLLLDEPTHGIDIAAKMQVHALIRKFTRDGGGVIVSSSDLSELARICDSVLTVRDRAITGRIERKDGKGGNWTKRICAQRSQGRARHESLAQCVVPICSGRSRC